MPRPSALPHLAFVIASTLAIAGLHWLGTRTLEGEGNERGPNFAERMLDAASVYLWTAEAKAEDLIARVGQKAAANPDLVFLAIDEPSVSVDLVRDIDQLAYANESDASSRKALELMSTEFPWPREVHALILERLMGAGARAVVFDLRFPKPREGDEPFREALERYQNNVVVAAGFADALERTFDAPTPSLIPETVPRDSRVGFDNWWADQDGKIRRTQYRWAFQYGVVEEGEELSVAARTLEKIGRQGMIPRDRQPHRVRFAGPAGTFPARSVFGIFAPSHWARNYDKGGFFKDKVIFIGSAGAWQQDEHPTPFGQMPGAELHMNAVNAALQNAFVAEPSMTMQLAIIVAAGLIAWLTSNLVARPYIRLILLIVGNLAWLGAAYLLYQHADLFIPIIAPLLALNVNGVSGLTRDILHERREKTRFRSTLERYVSHNVVDELLADRDQYTRVLGGGIRPVAILFSDIRGFSKVAASMEPHALVADLNEYFSAMVDCVFRNDGTLDKFIGDAVMAVWGNSRSKGATGDVRDAVTCAMEMRQELVLLNARRTAAGKPELNIGIGLNFGEVVVGNIGSPSRMEFTVIGEAVNVAWRLQELTKGVGTDVILGERLCQLLGNDITTGPIESAELPGHGSFSFARLLPSEDDESRRGNDH
jgi:adenylate cyclase